MSGDLCPCGHERRDHIYNVGACRPGFACATNCRAFGEVRGGDDVESIPAMPPPPEWMPSFVRRNVHKRLPVFVADATRAFCYAQALADRDGKRRRVRKVDWFWMIEEVTR